MLRYRLLITFTQVNRFVTNYNKSFIRSYTYTMTVTVPFILNKLTNLTICL